jgi:hypothetical protein
MTDRRIITAIALPFMQTLAVIPLCIAQESVEFDFNPEVVISKPMQPIVDAPFVHAKDATELIVSDNEIVLGVVVNGKARAYPINMITGPRREIINDKLGGLPIAATW